MQLQINGTNKKTSREQQAALQALQRMKQGQSRHDVEQKWYQHLSPKLEKTMVYEEQKKETNDIMQIAYERKKHS